MWTFPLDRVAIKEIIPHRDPFLLLDEILELEPGHRAVALKRVTQDEFWVPGHFPGLPVMPGVLIVEALAQVGAAIVLSQPENKGKIALFAGIDQVRFKRQVKPGETMLLECEITKVKGPIGKGSGRATVNGELACRGEIMFAVQ
jgi:3-hydroxyacyl-[acyl-carrier-protein] dehydratase